MNHATGAFKTQHNPILRLSHGEHGGDLFPQAADLMRIHTAFEIQHPGTRFSGGSGYAQLRSRLCLFGLLLQTLLLRLVPQLLPVRIEQGDRELLLHLFILLAQVCDAKLPALAFALRQVNDKHRHDGDGNHHRHNLG